DHLEDGPPAGRLGGARRAARGAPALRGEPRLRLRRGQPDPGCAPRPREGGQRPGRAPRGPGPGVGGGLPGLGRGAADERLRALPSLPRAQCRASLRVRILLRGRRALRRPARRLRAGDEDGRGARGLCTYWASTDQRWRCRCSSTSLTTAAVTATTIKLATRAVKSVW